MAGNAHVLVVAVLLVVPLACGDGGAGGEGARSGGGDGGGGGAPAPGRCESWADWECFPASDGFSNGCVAHCDGSVIRCNNGEEVCVGSVDGCSSGANHEMCEGCRYVFETCPKR